MTFQDIVILISAIALSLQLIWVFKMYRYQDKRAPRLDSRNRLDEKMNTNKYGDDDWATPAK